VSPRAAIHLIVLMCLLSHSGFGGSRVVVTLYALELGANQFTVGLLMALYALLPMLLAVAIGRFADRVGARIPMLLGTSGVAIALLLPPLAPGLVTLHLSALLLGSSFHFFFVTVTGIAGGIGGAENRAHNYALISMGFAAAGLIGPTTAGLAIDHFGHLPTFVLLSAFLLGPILLLWLKPDIVPRPGARSAADNAGSMLDLWRAPVLRNTFVASGIISSAWDLFQFYLPVYGHSIGLSASAIGAILGVFASATFVIRIVLPHLVKRFAETRILTHAIFVAACAFALMPLFRNAYALAACGFLLGLGVGCGQPMSMSLIYALAPAGRASEAAGLRVMVNNVTHLVIPLLFGSVGTAFGYMPVFLSNSALLTAGGMLMRRQPAAHAR
jgi:MFS family permease